MFSRSPKVNPLLRLSEDEAEDGGRGERPAGWRSSLFLSSPIRSRSLKIDAVQMKK